MAIRNSSTERKGILREGPRTMKLGSRAYVSLCTHASRGHAHALGAFDQLLGVGKTVQKGVLGVDMQADD